MKNILFLLLLSASLHAQEQKIFAADILVVPIHGGHCEFNLNDTLVYAKLFNPEKVGSAWYRKDITTTVTVFLAQGAVIFNPDTIISKGWIWVREPAVNYNLFPLHLPGDPERSQYIATRETVTALVCGCYAKKRKVVVEIDTLPMVPVKAVQRFVTRA